MYLYMHLLQPPANLAYLTTSYPSNAPQQETGGVQKDDAAAKPPAGFIFAGPPPERTIPAPKADTPQKAAALDATRASKEEAVDAIEDNPAGDAFEDDAFEDNPAAASLQRQYLMNCGRAALKNHAKEAGLKVSGNTKTSTLIQLLLDNVRSANPPPSPTLPYDHRPFTSTSIVQMYLAILFGMDLLHAPYNVSQNAPTDVPLQCAF